jgi:hypothetical protein
MWNKGRWRPLAPRGPGENQRPELDEIDAVRKRGNAAGALHECEPWVIYIGGRIMNGNRLQIYSRSTVLRQRVLALVEELAEVRELRERVGRAVLRHSGFLHQRGRRPTGSRPLRR